MSSKIVSPFTLGQISSFSQRGVYMVGDTTNPVPVHPCASAPLMPGLIQHPSSCCRVGMEHVSRHTPEPGGACLLSASPEHCVHHHSLSRVSWSIWCWWEYSGSRESNLKPSLQTSELLWGKTMPGTSCISSAQQCSAWFMSLHGINVVPLDRSAQAPMCILFQNPSFFLACVAVCSPQHQPQLAL